MMLFGDVTKDAAVIAACSGFVAAALAAINLALSIRRERPSLAVFLRSFSRGPHGLEDYLEVVATNVGHRPVTVVNMGLRMRATANRGRSWRVDDGAASPGLPAILNDGEIVSMTWLLDELGQRFAEGEVEIIACFAQDGRGGEQVRDLPEPLNRG